MKTIMMLYVITLLSSCGAHKTDPVTGSPVCMTRDTQRAKCYVEEMVKLGNDINMDAWVKNYCASVYVSQGCYTKDYH